MNKVKWNFSHVKSRFKTVLGNFREIMVIDVTTFERYHPFYSDKKPFKDYFLCWLLFRRLLQVCQYDFVWRFSDFHFDMYYAMTERKYKFLVGCLNHILNAKSFREFGFTGVWFREDTCMLACCSELDR